ncbi:hypothetical protein VOLCADRAFT_97845 [Volvox carteri f. nagariensis]|uniref:Uncharacterized protein n=1 Tax=Volvox carteri f. nagariensis TaxID=3068 RepID=D8UDS9_VOLCA|nr:uncharacterized protein VOLCADRAFT_97845 [Volvox carteri f. nagariensis]EFJ42096.1 hypothetical protein VOLCADRAFT_97845 [Volvox carteri f. nagariensis]|eukprot:XP_002956793.1 hypothetical protein VOLCADRAFT_97845 [Volvox carteri f. nagariensis]
MKDREHARKPTKQQAYNAHTQGCIISSKDKRKSDSQPAMNKHSSGVNEAFPSLSGGIGADGLGFRQFESSLDRIVSGSRAQERTEPDSHPVAYNSRFQFFHSKRTSIINDSAANDVRLAQGNGLVWDTDGKSESPLEDKSVIQLKL